MTAAVEVPAANGARLPRGDLVAYGILGMPFAMAALPLYVHLPKFYGDHLGVPLASLGALLLALRVADGVVDPLLGAWSDRSPSRKRLIAAAVPFLAAGMVALFMPQVRGEGALLAWLAVCLLVVYFAFSLATITHGAWGAELSADPVERTRITAVRETFALAGVVVASIAPSMLGDAATGLPRLAIAFAACIVGCMVVALAWAPAAYRGEAKATPLFADLKAPLADPHFRRLFVVFVANGIASSIPATLVLFYIADVLQAQAREGMFLAIYFLSAAASMPLWVRLSARLGKVRAWHVAMATAILAFAWSALLGSGDVAAFAVICAASGFAFGADLALPPSLLADVIDRDTRMRSTGAYFGLWTMATKLNLALAAGIGLPLLAILSYAPGAREATALSALAFVYAIVPCGLKIGAALALAWFDRAWRKA